MARKEYYLSIIVQDITGVPTWMSVSEVFIRNFESCRLIQQTSFNQRTLLLYLKSRMPGEGNGTNTKQGRLLEEVGCADGKGPVENLRILGSHFLKLAAGAIRDFNNQRDKNGLSYPRKAMIRNGMAGCGRRSNFSRSCRE